MELCGHCAPWELSFGVGMWDVAVLRKGKNSSWPGLAARFKLGHGPHSKNEKMCATFPPLSLCVLSPDTSCVQAYLHIYLHTRRLHPPTLSNWWILGCTPQWHIQISGRQKACFHIPGSPPPVWPLTADGICQEITCQLWK